MKIYSTILSKICRMSFMELFFKFILIPKNPIKADVKDGLTKLLDKSHKDLTE